MAYGKRLAYLRKKNNLSQEEFSRRININRSTYARYETGKTQPDYETLDRIANFYEVSVDYLLDRTDNTNPSSTINVAGQDITLTSEEKKIFEEMKKHPVMFNDLASDPERKIKRLIKMWEFIKEDIEEMENEEEPDDIIEDDD